jgi:hypothetical protein
MSIAPRIKPRVVGVLPQETRLRIANERKARGMLTRALGSLCRSGSFARVKLMQAADLWDLHHLAKRGRLDRSADYRGAVRTSRIPIHCAVSQNFSP